MKTFIYPGSFDPLTKGHLDIAKRAAKLCDELIVAVLHNKGKTACIDLSTRVNMVQKCLKNIPNIKVMSFDGLLVEFMKINKATAIVRGLRSESDFRYELEIATANKILYPDYETILLPCRHDMAFTSSSVVREVASFGGDISAMVPEQIVAEVVSLLN